MDLHPSHQGTDQRIGTVQTDPIGVAAAEINGAPVYTLAGNSYPYRPQDGSPFQANPDPSFFNAACADASFLRGVINQVIEEIEDFVASNGAIVGPALAAVAAAGGVGLLGLLGALALIALLLRELLDLFDADDRLGEHMNNLRGELLDPTETDPVKRAAGLLAWQAIAYLVFESLQAEVEFGAKSFAVMDRKHYLDLGCEQNVASIEVFFDALDSRLVAFIDALIAFEIKQELMGKAFLGYASLRFMGRTAAHLGMQRYPITCSIEVAGLKDMSGSQELVDYAHRLARHPDWGGHPALGAGQ